MKDSTSAARIALLISDSRQDIRLVIFIILSVILYMKPTHASWYIGALTILSVVTCVSRFYCLTRQGVRGIALLRKNLYGTFFCLAVLAIWLLTVL